MSAVDDVKARLDIVDVVSGYVNLQKAGRNFKALCPFHHERTPSFVVFPDTQTWRCFGACGEGGDVFSFAMKAEGWDFSETLRELAKRAGVELKPPTASQIEQQADHERLWALLDETVYFFHDTLLHSPDAQFARNYLDRRHLESQTIEAFGLGYAPNDWHQALQHLQKLGYSQDEIIEAGVAIRSDKGAVYDRFRNRLAIPIRDGRGRFVGFGARALAPDDNPKYLNSPQTPLFDKSRLLFGLDAARRAIRETETAVIVEGYMDVMQAHQAGFNNVVAQMGTALTEAQLRQLDKYASRLVLALDPDAAGVNATLRGLDVARQTLDGDQPPTFDPRGMIRYSGMLNMDIRVVSLPDGYDPDDLIHEAPEAWQNLIQDAVPVAEYVIRQVTEQLPLKASYHEREAVARQLLPILMATENDLLLRVNLQALARRIRIDEQTLLQWAHSLHLAKVQVQPTISEQRKLASRTASQPKIGGPPGQSPLQEAFCLRLLIQQPERLYAANRKLRELQSQTPELADVLGPLNVDDFVRPDYQAIFQALQRSLNQDESDPLDYLYETLPPELLAVIEELQVPLLETFRQELSQALATELESVLRDQTRVNSLPEPDTTLLIQEALILRRCRLERERNELYFLQQDDQISGGDLTGQHYQTTFRANIYARRLITLALNQMKAIVRET